VKENRRVSSTCNRLELQTLGSQPDDYARQSPRSLMRNCNRVQIVAQHNQSNGQTCVWSLKCPQIGPHTSKYLSYNFVGLMELLADGHEEIGRPGTKPKVFYPRRLPPPWPSSNTLPKVLTPHFFHSKWLSLLQFIKWWERGLGQCPRRFWAYRSRSMVGENRRLVTYEPVEFEK
jgi:hypothetical protein